MVGADLYRIFLSETFEKKLKKLISAKSLADFEKKFYEHVLMNLRSNPYYGPSIKKLRSYKPDTWRYRVGDYRIFYQIDDDKKIVHIKSIEHRKDAY